MTRLPLLIAVLAVALAAVPGALADTRTVSDPRRDVKEDPEFVYADLAPHLLDIASIRHGHSGRLLTHRLTTYGRWGSRLLAQGGEIFFYFSTDRDAAVERRLDLRYARGRLSAVMRNTRGRIVGRGSASRPNSRMVQVAFARSLLRAGIRRYRWFAVTGVSCRRQYRICGDRAPGGRLVAHRLR